MKLWTPLWSDPIGWSNWFAKTKIHVLLVALAHVGMGLLCLKSVGERLIFPFVMMGVLFPCCYLCALHQLLNIVKQKANAEQHAGPVPSKSTQGEPADESSA